MYVRSEATGYLTRFGSVRDGMGACLYPYVIPIRHVTSHVITRVDLKLVDIDRNHLSNTLKGLLDSYRSRVSCNLAPPAYIRAGKDPSRGRTLHNLSHTHPSTFKAIQTT